MPRTRIAAVFVAAAALTGGPARAQCSLGRLTANPPVGGQQFGRAVAMATDVMIIGAPLEDQPGAAAGGAAYVFRLVGGVWTQEARLSPTDPTANTQFGRSVAISGDVAIVGAPLDNLGGADAGSAYVFRRSAQGQWAQEQKLHPIESGPGDQFGAAVAYDGVFALIGAPNHDENGFDSGCAFIFVKNGASPWGEETQLFASDGVAGDQYGRSVTVSGQYFGVGAPRKNVWGAGSGAVYFGRRIIAGLIADDGRFIPDDGALGDEFGSSVALRGLTALIGAPLDDDPAAGADSGSAYIFRRIGTFGPPWLQETKLLPTGAGQGDQFGQSVALEADAALLGAGLFGAANAGRAQAFLRRPSGLWQPWSVLAPADLQPGEEFGGAVALQGSTGAVGGRLLGWAAPSAGGVGLFMIGRAQGDSNGDGAVDFVDLNNVLSDYGTTGSALPGDVNANGAVDFIDLNLVLGAFGAVCP